MRWIFLISLNVQIFTRCNPSGSNDDSPVQVFNESSCNILKMKIKSVHTAQATYFNVFDPYDSDVSNADPNYDLPSTDLYDTNPKLLRKSSKQSTSNIRITEFIEQLVAKHDVVEEYGPQLKVNCDLLIDIFKYFFPDELMSGIVEETCRYASLKG